MSEYLLVRLKPFNKRQGIVCQQYMIGGIRFRSADGWYRVPKATVERLNLRQLPQQQAEPFGPKLFDVCTQDEAEDIDEQGRLQSARASAINPNTVVGRDGSPRRVHAAGRDGTEPLVQGAPVSTEAPAQSSSDAGSAATPRDVVEHHTEPAAVDETEPEAVIEAPKPRRASPPRRRRSKS